MGESEGTINSVAETVKSERAVTDRGNPTAQL